MPGLADTTDRLYAAAVWRNGETEKQKGNSWFLITRILDAPEDADKSLR